MEKCEVCGREADIHHIIHRSEGGLDFSLNYKYLCSSHHRGKNSPHSNSKIDIEYKLDLQDKLEKILWKEYYTIDELIILLDLNKSKAKKFIKQLKHYKEGYKSSEVIFCIMGRKRYTEDMLDEYEDFWAVSY